MKNWRFLTNILLHFENDTRCCHGYNGRRIGTCMPSIKRCHFHWPWVIPNLDFMVVILLNSKMLQDRAIFNGLERPIIHISRSLQYSTLNISLTVQDNNYTRPNDRSDLEPRTTLNDLAKYFLVHEPKGNLPTPNTASLWQYYKQHY